MPNLRDLDVRWVSLVDRAAVRNAENPAEPQRFLVWKADRDNTDPKGGSMTPEEMEAAVNKAETDLVAERERAEKAEQEHADLQARIDELEKNDSTDETEPVINKADLPEPVRKALEKAEADAVAAEARIAKAEKDAQSADEIAKAERDQRVTREYVVKAEGYRALVVKAEEFGPVLKEAAEKLSKEAFEAIETVLKAADEQIATSNLFKEQGRGGEPNAGNGDNDLTRKADDLQKADSTLTRTEAMRQAARQDPKAQATYLETVR